LRDLKQPRSSTSSHELCEAITDPIASLVQKRAELAKVSEGRMEDGDFGLVLFMAQKMTKRKAV
jgi:hypothetical protein